MTYKTSYELHHNFPKLADESGFTFNTHRPRVHIDWNKIKLIDIENLIRERKFILVEQHINNILECVLESEFDVRILDEGVIKMFRLAQLAVEYQQFCRHYLDRSVYVLRQEITSLAQELDETKKNLHDKEEELRKIKKRTRQSYKTSLPYGNDNIAAMILKTLNNRADFIPSTSRDFDQYNKCKYCEKVFLNQLYLQSHISRRHANHIDLPEKETNNETEESQKNNENNKLNVEIMELKDKLKEMENLIINVKKQDSSPILLDTNNTSNIVNSFQNVKKSTKDAEVSTNNEDYLLNKIEEWKKEEHEKYNNEISTLRTQIMDSINSLRQNEMKQETNDSNDIDNLRSTIAKQGAEILSLKQYLKQSETEAEARYNKKLSEAEEQISLWAKRADTQSKQYETLLQKLNDVTRDAKEYRELAETERKRAAQLQSLLENNLINKVNENPSKITKFSNEQPMNNSEEKDASAKLPKQMSSYKSSKLADRDTLQSLHRKAQELLNIGSLSSNTSDSSSTDQMKSTPVKQTQMEETTHKPTCNTVRNGTSKDTKNIHIQNFTDNRSGKITKQKERKSKKKTSKPIINGILAKENASGIEPASPIKVTRAKLTEEVNNRLVSLGVDPLKIRLPKNLFQSQREHLQKQQEVKVKKNPSHEKIRYSLLAYLDSNITNEHYNIGNTNKYIQEKKPKTLRGLTSMISDVKSKAISLVKSYDQNVKDKRKAFSSEVAKRAISLLKTPPGSTASSPNKQNKLPNKENISSADPSQKYPNSGSNSVVKTHKTKKPGNLIREKVKTVAIDLSDSSEESYENEHKYFNTTIVEQSMKTTETLTKLPIQRPSSSNSDNGQITSKYTKLNRDPLTRTQSTISLSKTNAINIRTKSPEIEDYHSSDDAKSLSDSQEDKKYEDNSSPKKTKSVLKNASSTSSLNKKKVLFDMDAIQMKSISATPSQSITEKSDNDNYELGLVNLDTEEWDISSIENEPLKNDTKLKLITRTSPKIAELKQTIESQLARRSEITSGLAGKIDVLGVNKTITKDANVGGSNTSLGSSILDESDNIPTVNRKAFAVSKKEDSELDISEFSIDGISYPNKNESF